MRDTDTDDIVLLCYSINRIATGQAFLLVELPLGKRKTPIHIHITTKSYACLLNHL